MSIFFAAPHLFDTRFFPRFPSIVWLLGELSEIPPFTRSQGHCSLTNEALTTTIPSSAGYGIFAKLPFELRREIWRYLLLVRCNILPSANVGRRGRYDDEDGWTDRSLGLRLRRVYDLCPRILWTSKAIYQEASDVLYRENLFIRLQREFYGAFEIGPFHCLAFEASMGAFRNRRYIFRTNPRPAACKLHAVDVTIMHGDRRGLRGHAYMEQIMIPVSALYHVVTYMHSMLVANEKDSCFGGAYKMVFTVANRYSIAEDRLFERLLIPFQGLCGMQEARIIGIERTARIRQLENSLTRMQTDRDIHQWINQIGRLFYITFRQHNLNNDENGVAARDAWEEITTNIRLGYLTWVPSRCIYKRTDLLTSYSILVEIENSKMRVQSTSIELCRIVRPPDRRIG